MGNEIYLELLRYSYKFSFQQCNKLLKLLKMYLVTSNKLLVIAYLKGLNIH